MNEVIQNFQTSRPEFNLLGEGEHVVRLIRYKILDSFKQYSDEPKPSERIGPWTNPCPQLAITVVNAEEGKSGGMTHRLNFEGYTKFKELSDKDQQSGNYEEHDGYACLVTKDGLVRVADETRTKACANIANQFAMSLGIPEGSNLIEALDEAIEDSTTFRIEVVNVPFDGNDQLRIRSYRQVAQAPVEADFED